MVLPISFFLEPYTCKNKYVFFSTINCFSPPEFHITNGNYREFIYYWATAARGYYPRTNEPWRTLTTEAGDFQFSALIPTLDDHPGDIDPDINGDHIVQMQEAFAYANKMNTWSDDGYYYKPYNNTYEEQFSEDWNQLSLNQDLLTLGGIAGQLEGSVQMQGDLVVNGVLSFDNNVTLTVPANSQLTFLDNSKLVCNSGSLNTASNSLLKIGDDVEIDGLQSGYSSQIVVYGDIEAGDNLWIHDLWHFKIYGGATLGNATIHNTDLYNYAHKPTIFNDLTVTNSTFYNYAFQKAELNNCSFNQSTVDSYMRDDAIYSHCQFNNTWFILKRMLDPMVSINNCTFTTTTTRPGISIEGYNYYSIMNNNFDGFYNAIQMDNCSESYGNHNIYNNEITNSTHSALNLYNSVAKISGNNIHNNTRGISLFNNCNTSIYSRSNVNYSQAQKIMNNDSYELYTSSESFPWYIKYNVIADDDNTGGQADALIYATSNAKITLKDVTNNNWGSQFNASQDLYPSGEYDYLPIWTPGSGGISTDEAEILYTSSKTDFEEQKYSDAQVGFKMVISQYPETKYAHAAMKDLFVAEKYLDNNFTSLQEYYQNEPEILEDESLYKLSDHLKNKCEISLENWQPAIDYYEVNIENPDSPEDSIFAIIDLGRLYILMNDSSNKSVKGIGKMTEHIPKNIKEFEKNQTYLLSLLPFKSDTQEDEQITKTEDVLSQNTPNPFSDLTSVEVNVYKSGSITIKVMDISGKTIRNLQLELEEGHHQIPVELINEPSGIYYYSLYVDGVYRESKKMLLVK